jgi:hypothetical protein
LFTGFLLLLDAKVAKIPETTKQKEEKVRFYYLCCSSIGSLKLLQQCLFAKVGYDGLHPLGGQTMLLGQV